MVPLAEAWDSGAYDWTPERREAYANDLGADRGLVAVTARTNRSRSNRSKADRSKADRDQAQWTPPAESATCTYLVDWTATKLRWSLTADDTERTALLELAEPSTESVVEYEAARHSSSTGCRTISDGRESLPVLTCPSASSAKASRPKPDLVLQLMRRTTH